MTTISIDFGDELSRATRFPARLAVATGEVSAAAKPWGIVSDVSANGLFVRTTKLPAPGSKLRLWFVDGRQLREVEGEVTRHSDGGVGLSFDDDAFYHWAFDHSFES